MFYIDSSETGIIQGLKNFPVSSIKTIFTHNAAVVNPYSSGWAWTKRSLGFHFSINNAGAFLLAHLCRHPSLVRLFYHFFRPFLWYYILGLLTYHDNHNGKSKMINWDWTKPRGVGKISSEISPLRMGSKEAHRTVNEKKYGFLCWPWNIVIYAVLLIALRLFAIPVILILMWVQQKNNPNGAQEGYCLSRTRKRLSWVMWGILWLAISGAAFWMFYMGLQQDRTYWENTDYVTLISSGVVGVLLLLLGLYMGYHGIRDTFFPEKSTLADSIRSQLPYPDEAPTVKELFAMVDNDLKEHGRWFDAVGIGQEWVLGDAATQIDRIRGIFVVDEIHTRHSSNHTTSRELKLILIDDRWQKWTTDFENPDELRAAADCLALRVPEARRGSNGQLSGFLSMDDAAREDFEREFRRGKSRRASAELQRETLGGGTQDMVLSAGGEVTSRVSVSLVEDHLRRCLSGEAVFYPDPHPPRGRERPDLPGHPRFRVG